MEGVEPVFGLFQGYFRAKSGPFQGCRLAVSHASRLDREGAGRGAAAGDLRRHRAGDDLQDGEWGEASGWMPLNDLEDERRAGPSRGPGGGAAGASRLLWCVRGCDTGDGGQE